MLDFYLSLPRSFKTYAVILRVLRAIYNFIRASFFGLKGTVDVTSGELPFMDCRVRFTTLPFKPLSDH